MRIPIRGRKSDADVFRREEGLDCVKYRDTQVVDSGLRHEDWKDSDSRQGRRVVSVVKGLAGKLVFIQITQYWTD